VAKRGDLPGNKTNGSTSLQPAPIGNRRAVTHGAYVTRFTPAELEEIREIEDELRSLAPFRSDTLEPMISVLGGQFWRRERLFRDLDEHGVIRGRADRGRVAPAVTALDALERQIADGLKTLGMTTKAAAELNLNLAQARSRERFDTSRLNRDEQVELDRLLEKARASDA
jgi:hypothetical protein